MQILTQLAPNARRATVLLASTALLGSIAGTAQAAPAGTPFGNFERAAAVTGGVEVKGWTIDPDTASSINVRYTVDGSPVATRLASDSRPDVANAFPGYGDKHGFRETISTSSGTHEVCAIALNTGQGEDRILHCYDVTVAGGGGSPFGSFERATGEAGAVEVKGWTVDPDTTDPIKVRISVGGVTTLVDADLTRNDIEAAFPGSGTEHGFLETIPAAAGSHRVCATAVDVGVGSDKDLGCYNVTVAQPTSSSTTTTTVSTTSGKPTSSTTGVPSGTQLTRHNGDLVITTAGTVIDGLDIYGTVSVRADNVVIKNSRVRGKDATYNTPLVSMNKGNRNLVIRDTEIAPDNPSPYLYGIMGWEFTIERVNIHHVIDSLHIYGNNVTVKDSYLHDNVHYTNDPNWGGRPSHDDGIQILSGDNIKITGSRIEGAYNAAVQITQDKGRTSNVSFVGNWIDGGGCSINVADKGLGPVTGLVATNNTFGRNTRHYDCAMITPSSSPINATGNVFTDGSIARVKDGD